MLTIETLNDFGANTKEGLSRCMNNEAFYLRMVNMGLADKNFGRLQAAVDAGNVEDAFEAAHALKGVMGNLSLTPIYAPVSELTEKLRGRNEMVEVGELLGQVMKQLEKVRLMSL